KALAALYGAAKGDQGLARRVLGAIVTRAQNGEIDATTQAALKETLGPSLRAGMEGRKPLRFEAALLLGAREEEARLDSPRAIPASGSYGGRLRALGVLAAHKDAAVLKHARALLDAAHPAAFRGEVIAALGKLEDEKAASVLLGAYATLPADLRP